MSLESFMPNWGLLKSPWNWFVVAFSVAILVLISHFVFQHLNKVA